MRQEYFGNRRRWDIKAVWLLAALLVMTIAVRNGHATGSPRGNIGLGGNHSCLIANDGTVQCWGHNADGELGDGTTTERHTPQRVLNLTGVTQVAGGSDHTCALKSDGTVWCWGDSSYGQLGDYSGGDPFTKSHKVTPVQVLGLNNVVEITAGADHNCARKSDGTLWCWGFGGSGQVGNGGNGIWKTPYQVVDLPYPATTVAAGAAMTCALLSDGSVWCWGNNLCRQLGRNPYDSWCWASSCHDLTSTNRPLRVPNIPLAVNKLAVGAAYACASDGASTWCWGANNSGQIGDGTKDSGYCDNAKTATLITTYATDIVALDAGTQTTFALRADGTVLSWGDNSAGMYGNGTQNDGSNRPLATMYNVAELATGISHACGRLTDGRFMCWGNNIFGQVGDGTSQNYRPWPTQVPGITPSTYTLSLAKSGSGTGTVTSNPAGITCGATCTGNFTAGALVTLTASPAGGSAFAGWSGACSGGGNCIVTMDSAKSVTAAFNAMPANYVGCFTDDNNRALPIRVSGGETVESCVQKVAAAGYAYAGLQWYGECWAGDTPGYVQVDDTECNTLCNANPAEMCGGAWYNSIYRTGVTPSKKLSVAKSGSGSGTVTSSPAGISCGATCTAGFTTGTMVSLTASPSTGSTFAGWSGACSGTGTCTVTMSAAQSVTATFNVIVNGPQISAIVDGITYSYTINTTTTIAIFGSGFSIGGNMIQFQRAGNGDVWLYNGDGHYFWDGNGTQINASLDSRVASGTWNVTVRNASGGVSNTYTLTIQGSTVSNAYYCYSTSYASYGYQNWLCNAAYNPSYCYTSTWQWTSCPSADNGNTAKCGNGICEAGENGSNCGQDCCDQTTACGQTKQNQGVYYCRNMYHYDNGSAYWRGFQWITVDDALQMCNESWEAQEGSYYQTQYQCGGQAGKCHSIPGGYY